MCGLFRLCRLYGIFVRLTMRVRETTKQELQYSDSGCMGGGGGLAGRSLCPNPLNRLFLFKASKVSQGGGGSRGSANVKFGRKRGVFCKVLLGF